MKLNRIALATLMAIGVATAANAADQGSGKVTFVGSIIDAPCSIAPESLDQTVQMGAISNVALADGGASAPVAFSIELTDCAVPTAGVKDTVTVTFTGTESTYPAGAGSLGLLGSASGAFIELATADSTRVELNTATAARQIADGANATLSFTAKLKGAGTGIDVVPGSFQVPANFVLAYQ